MARQDNVKIITTALLVVLLLCSFIFGFIYRNEIYQKMQMMSKSNSMDQNDRVIEKRPVMTPPFPVQTESESGISKNQEDIDSEAKKRPNLPNQPSLDEMEAGISENSSKSNTVKTPQKIADEKTIPRETFAQDMKMAEDKMKVPSAIAMMDKPKNKLPAVSPKKEIRHQTVIYHHKSQKKSSMKRDRKQKTHTTSKVYHYNKPKINTKKDNAKKTASSVNAGDASLGARVSAMESKFVLQNQKNDKRFDEIEKRIDKLEKSLGSN